LYNDSLPWFRDRVRTAPKFQGSNAPPCNLLVIQWQGMIDRGILRGMHAYAPEALGTQVPVALCLSRFQGPATHTACNSKQRAGRFETTSPLPPERSNSLVASFRTIQGGAKGPVITHRQVAQPVFVLGLHTFFRACFFSVDFAVLSLLTLVRADVRSFCAMSRR
jgi:hypothetical protein